MLYYDAIILVCRYAILGSSVSSLSSCYFRVKQFLLFLNLPTHWIVDQASQTEQEKEE